MSLYYYLLGFTALINQKLSRIRVNFIPLNFVAILTFGSLFCASLTGSLEAVQNGDKPQTGSIEQLVAAADHGKCYVSAHGVLFHDALYFHQESRKHHKVETVGAWAPLFEIGGNMVLIVERPATKEEVAEDEARNNEARNNRDMGSDDSDNEELDNKLAGKEVENQKAANQKSKHNKPSSNKASNKKTADDKNKDKHVTVLDATLLEKTVTGMLRPMDSELQDNLQQNEKGKLADVPINMKYVLVEGEHPFPPIPAFLGALICGVLGAAFLITFLQKYIVFQKMDRDTLSYTSQASPAIPQEGVDLRVTGRFVLDQNTTERFLNVPASIVTLENGDLALVSNIDASNRFMGIQVAKRAGLWAIILDRSSLNNLEKGLLYLGFSARPALRVKFIRGDSRTPDNAILSFQSDAEREAIIGELNKAAGYQLAQPVIG